MEDRLLCVIRNVAVFCSQNCGLRVGFFTKALSVAARFTAIRPFPRAGNGIA
jgi:hypothetical protein